jgi:NAD(P)-dependent dehydrogenase (short-subunit alcohol dehydrogenase family)
MNQKEVVVAIGAGGIGQAIARRQGTGRTVLLADLNEQTLNTGAETLTSTGHAVETHPVDVSSRGSVHALADAAAALGDVVNVVHTAGVSLVQRRRPRSSPSTSSAPPLCSRSSAA